MERWITALWFTRSARRADSSSMAEANLRASARATNVLGWVKGGAIALSMMVTANAGATKPRPIDCAKAQAVQVGWTQKQVEEALGKPYITQFGGANVSLAWQAPDGKDSLAVRFETDSKDAEQRRVVGIAGSCSGVQILHLAESRLEAVSLSELDQYPHGRDLPRTIAFQGVTYYLAFVADGRDRKIRFAEYVPAGQSLTHWRQMIAVFLHGDGSVPLQKLDEMEGIARRTRNPNFKRLDVATDGGYASGALPMLREDSVEYQVARWVSIPGGVQAAVHFVRSYNDEGLAREEFVAREAGRASTDSESLKALSTIVPPDLGGVRQLIFTRDGMESGEVLVESQVDAHR